MPLCRDTLSYTSCKDPQEALRCRLGELAAVRVRFGYRRLTVLLKREGWAVMRSGSTGFIARRADGPDTEAEEGGAGSRPARGSDASE